MRSRRLKRPPGRDDTVKRGWFLPLVLVLLVSCSKTELYHNLSEDEVNEILVVLQENGISATKKKEIVRNEVTWTVAVESHDLSRARAILVERNLPRRKQRDIADVYSGDALIESEGQQKAKFIIGMRGNVINALRKNPDVIDADVVINIPDKEEFGSSDQKKRPTASLIIKIRPTAEAQATLTEAKLQRVVASAIPDLDPRDVTVIISYVGAAPVGSPGFTMPGQAPPVITAGGPATPLIAPSKSAHTVTVAGVEVAPESSNRLKIYLGVFLGLLALLSIALIVTIIHTHRIRQEARGPAATVDGQLVGPDENKRLGPGQ